MKSIQTKFIFLILSSVLLSVLIIGSAGILNSEKIIKEDSEQIMALLCSEQTEIINAQLSRIEQSVQMLTVYASDHLESLERLKTDTDYQQKYLEELNTIALNAAQNTEGAIAVYVRFNPDLLGPTAGLFLNRTHLNGDFQELPPTDLSRYNPTDTEHVGWYTIPVTNGIATWMEPYLNRNIDVFMISYIVPYYFDQQLVGVVGMDIRFDSITDKIKAISAYDSGYGILINRDHQIMYHPELPLGTNILDIEDSLLPIVNQMKNHTNENTLFLYQWKNQKKYWVYQTLINNMKLAISVPMNEIDYAKNELIFNILLSGILITIIAISGAVLMARRLIQPLKELNQAAMKVAEGNLDVSISIKTNDEIGTLGNSFLKTVDHLKHHINYINSLAYRDSLTGIKNKTAYLEAIVRLDDQIHIGWPHFAVLVFDINNLKTVNDTFGHDLGDQMIIQACTLIGQTFLQNPIYRIGGDEVVVLVENPDKNALSEQLNQFDQAILQFNQSIDKSQHISIAKGVAFYNNQCDVCYNDVFKRADEAMYKNKQEMKENLRNKS